MNNISEDRLRQIVRQELESFRERNKFKLKYRIEFKFRRIYRDYYSVDTYRDVTEICSITFWKRNRGRKYFLSRITSDLKKEKWE